MIIRQAATFLVLLTLAGCDFDVPITREPTRAIEERLVGNWTLVQEKPELITIRRLDKDHYVISSDGDIYRAFHSDVAGMPLVSVQNLNDAERKYLYVTWRLSDDGQRLTLRSINTELIPAGLKTSAEVAELLKRKRDDPSLFREPADYTRAK